MSLRTHFRRYSKTYEAFEAVAGDVPHITLATYKEYTSPKDCAIKDNEVDVVMLVPTLLYCFYKEYLKNSKKNNFVKFHFEKGKDPKQVYNTENIVRFFDSFVDVDERYKTLDPYFKSYTDVAGALLSNCNRLLEGHNILKGPSKEAIQSFVKHVSNAKKLDYLATLINSFIGYKNTLEHYLKAKLEKTPDGKTLRDYIVEKQMLEALDFCECGQMMLEYAISTVYSNKGLYYEEEKGPRFTEVPKETKIKLDVGKVIKK